MGIVTSRTVHVCAYTYWLCGPCHKNVSCYAGQHPPPGFPQTELTQNKHETDRKTNWNRPKFSLPSASYRAVHHYLFYFLHLALLYPPKLLLKNLNSLFYRLQMDDIDAMFTHLLGEMDHLSQVSFLFFFLFSIWFDCDAVTDEHLRYMVIPVKDWKMCE